MFSFKPETPASESSKTLPILLGHQDANMFSAELNGFLDSSNITFILGHIHKEVAKKPDTLFIYTYADDRFDVLTSLKYLFMKREDATLKNTDLIPNNVTLHLSRSGNRDQTEFTITGTGGVAANHIEYIQLLIQCAGFDINSSDEIKSRDIVSHLCMKDECNLKKFEQWCNLKTYLPLFDQEMNKLSTHATHGKHDQIDKLLKALRDLRNNLQADLDAYSKNSSEGKVFISPSTYIVQETLKLLISLHACNSEDDDSKKLIKQAIHEYETNCSNILSNKKSYFSSFSSYFAAPKQLTTDIEAIIKNAKVVTKLEEVETKGNSIGYGYIPFLK